MRTLCYRIPVLFTLALVSIMFSGCATSSKQQLLAASGSQVELRSIQTRAFDTTDKQKMLRTIISTLQDLNFVIDRADLTIGSVTSSKFTANSLLKISITVRPKGKSQLLVRANAQYGLNAVEDPEPYQDFFNALGKAIFFNSPSS